VARWIDEGQIGFSLDDTAGKHFSRIWFAARNTPVEHGTDKPLRNVNGWAGV
jgi:hypothetical protein